MLMEVFSQTLSALAAHLLPTNKIQSKQHINTTDQATQELSL
jgi:hypothetical protein